MTFDVICFTDIYHTTFDWPSSNDIASRLQEVEGNSEDCVIEKLVDYHRHIDGIIAGYSKTHKSINADQPKADVFSQGVSLDLKLCLKVCKHTEGKYELITFVLIEE